MKRTIPALFALAVAAALAGCTSTVPAEPTSPSATASSPAATTEAAPAEVDITDPWVKATDTEMTGAFGTLTNNTGEPIHVVGVSSTVTERNELHEMVAQDGTMMMAEMADGFVIEAGADFVLEPGGNHLMLMDLTAPIEAGENVELTLEFENGGTFTWVAPVRTYAGANEEYVEDAESGGMEPTATPTP